MSDAEKNVEFLRSATRDSKLERIFNKRLKGT